MQYRIVGVQLAVAVQMSLAHNNHKKSVLTALLRPLETQCSIVLAAVAGVVVFVNTLGPVHAAYNSPLRTKLSESFNTVQSKPRHTFRAIARIMDWLACVGSLIVHLW